MYVLQARLLVAEETKNLALLLLDHFFQLISHRTEQETLNSIGHIEREDIATPGGFF